MMPTVMAIERAPHTNKNPRMASSPGRGRRRSQSGSATSTVRVSVISLQDGSGSPPATAGSPRSGRRSPAGSLRDVVGRFLQGFVGSREVPDLTYHVVDVVQVVGDELCHSGLLGQNGRGRVHVQRAGDRVRPVVHGFGAGLDALHCHRLQAVGILLVVGVPEVADRTGRALVTLRAPVLGDTGDSQVVV